MMGWPPFIRVSSNKIDLIPFGPPVLYVTGQSLNLCLTLLMVWLMFEKVFPHALEVLQK